MKVKVLKIILSEFNTTQVEQENLFGKEFVTEYTESIISPIEEGLDYLWKLLFKNLDVDEAPLNIKNDNGDINPEIFVMFFMGYKARIENNIEILNDLKYAYSNLHTFMTDLEKKKQYDNYQKLKELAYENLDIIKKESSSVAKNVSDIIEEKVKDEKQIKLQMQNLLDSFNTIKNNVNRLKESFNIIDYCSQGKIEKLFLDELELEIKSLDELEIVKCEETVLPIYKHFALESELYNTPWQENPNENEYFSCYDAIQAYKGQYYSKDYSYFTCSCCEREICQQNPANGWMTQYRFISDYEMVCLKCLQDEYLKGIYDPTQFGKVVNNFKEGDIKFEYGLRKQFNCNEQIEDKIEYFRPYKTSDNIEEESSHPAMFYSHEELSNNGWEEVEFIGVSANQESVYRKCLELMSEGNYIIADIDRCGMFETSYNLWIKPFTKEEKEKFLIKKDEN